MERVWIAIAAAVPLFATDALAATRYDISNMTCSEVQTLIKREGEAVLAYRSSSILGLPIYDRYVKDRQLLRQQRTHQAGRRSDDGQKVLSGEQVRRQPDIRRTIGGAG